MYHDCVDEPEPKGIHRIMILTATESVRFGQRRYDARAKCKERGQSQYQCSAFVPHRLGLSEVRHGRSIAIALYMRALTYSG